MKLWALLGLCAVVAAAPNLEVLQEFEDLGAGELDPQSILLNTLVRQLFVYLRFIINNGSSVLNLPPLDPLELDEQQLMIPAGLVDLDLHLKEVRVTGLGRFVVHRSNLRPADLTFDVEISVPHIHIVAGQYDLYGELFKAIPLYGKGRAEFDVENFRFSGLLHLRRSDDGKAIMIKSIENASLQIPSFKSNLDGVIGGGDIDEIVNAVIEEVIVDYINRFQGAIAMIAANQILVYGNPVLEQLDTWKYLAPFV